MTFFVFDKNPMSFSIRNPVGMTSYSYPAACCHGQNLAFCAHSGWDDHSSHVEISPVKH